MRIAEEAGRRMSPKLRRLVRIGVGPFTSGVVAALAEEAFATGDCERNDDPIPGPELADSAADLDNFPHRFVTQHVTALHAGNDAIVDVQVGAADGATGDTDYGITGVLNCWVRHRLAPHVAFAMPRSAFINIVPGFT